MKKILHIPNYYPPHTGGIEYACYQIVSNLPDFQHEVICFNDMQVSKQEDYKGIKVIRCGIFKKVAGQALSLTYFKYLKHEIRVFQPDIIHFHAPNPLISLYLLLLIPKHIKLVVHFHAEIMTSRFLYGCYKPFERLLLIRADRILTTSPKMKDEVKLIASHKSKCIVIENVISTEDLKITPEDESAVAKLQAEYGNKKIVLSFGRHVSYKGLEYLLKAEPLIQEDCVIIVGGSGPLTSQLQKMTNSPRVHFIGRIPNKELRYYLHAAYLFAFPSITKAEAFGLTLAQCMYCYVPPVTFTIPESGVNYVSLANITGLEVENRNFREFAKAIDRLLSDEKLRQAYAEAGHQRVMDNFIMSHIKSKLLSLYDQL